MIEFIGTCGILWLLWTLLDSWVAVKEEMKREEQERTQQQ